MSQDTFIPSEKLRELAKDYPCQSFGLPEDCLESRVNEYVELFKEDILSKTNEIIDAEHHIAHLRVDIDEMWRIYNNTPRELIMWISESLAAIRGMLTDKRLETFVVYPLDVLVFVIYMARCFGHTRADKIVQWYRQYNLALQFLIPGIPSPKHRLSVTTINTVMRMISEEQMEQLLRSYFTAAKEILHLLMETEIKRYRDANNFKHVIALDGQELKASFQRGEESRRRKGAIGVTAYDTTTNQALAATRVQNKNNEIVGILRILPNIDVRGKLISSDALNTVAKISEAVINSGADYLFCIKANGGNKKLFKHTKELFNREMAQSNNQIIRAPTLTEKAHGRLDQYDICILPACLLPLDLQDLHKGLQTLVWYTKTSIRLVNGVPDDAHSSTSDRFYICSLPFSTETLNQIKFSILDYWSIESGHHGPLDNKRLFDQDSIQSCNENYLGNSITLNKLAYNFISYKRAMMAAASKNKKPPTFENVCKHYADRQSMISGPISLLLDLYEYFNQH